MTHANFFADASPLSEQELDTLACEQLANLRKSFAARPQLGTCDGLIRQRLGDELRLVSRMIELVDSRAG